MLLMDLLEEAFLSLDLDQSKDKFNFDEFLKCFFLEIWIKGHLSLEKF